MGLSPADSGKWISSKAVHVKVLDEGVEKCARDIFSKVSSGELDMTKMFIKTDIHPQKSDNSGIDWVFFADTLNFSFWMPETGPQYLVTYRGQTYTGYLAMCAAINRALDQGISLTDPAFFRNIDTATLGRLLGGDNNVPIPLLDKRVECLHEVGQLLVDKFSGSFVKVLEVCDNSATKLLSLVLDNFPCFRDSATFKGQEVSFHKRAQILVADLWCLFEGTGRGGFTDIDQLTMFADYRVPQSLQHYGVMSYDSELLTFLEQDQEMQQGDLREQEIRGCSIEAVERVTQRIKQLLAENSRGDLVVNSILVDQFLWGYRRQHAELMKKIPYHKVRSIYY